MQNIPLPWFDGQAEDAANDDVSVFRGGTLCSLPMESGIAHYRQTEQFTAAVTPRASRFASALVAAVVASCATSPEDLPPLLAHATSGSGWNSACPARTDTERALMAGQKLAVSTELSDRLERRFPHGSMAVSLMQELSREGFHEPTACEADSTIMGARFFHKGNGPLLYDLWAAVYWKVASDGTILWTKGFVIAQGL